MQLHIKFKCSFQILFKLHTKREQEKESTSSDYSICVMIFPIFVFVYCVLVNCTLLTSMLLFLLPEFLVCRNQCLNFDFFFRFSFFLVSFDEVFFHSWLSFSLRQHQFHLSVCWLVPFLFITDMGEFKANHSPKPMQALLTQLDVDSVDTNTNKYSTHNNFLLFRLKFRLVLCSREPLSMMPWSCASYFGIPADFLVIFHLVHSFIRSADVVCALFVGATENFNLNSTNHK